MATTSPDDLFSPDAPSPYNLTVDLAAMQTSVQAALTSVRGSGQYRVLTNAQRLTLSGPSLFEGLRVRTSDTKVDWIYTDSNWYPDDMTAMMKRSGTATNIADSISDISANLFWTQDWRDNRIAAYNNGWVIPKAGEWLVDFGVLLPGGPSLYLTVNRTTFTDFSQAFAYASSADQGALGTRRRRFAAGDVIRMFASRRTAGSGAWNTSADGSWFGIRYLGA